MSTNQMTIETPPQPDSAKERLRELQKDIENGINLTWVEENREELRKWEPSRLYGIEEKAPGALKALFAPDGNVDFGKNNLADRLIGLGDILNDEVQYVQVWDKGAKEPRMGVRAIIVTKNGMRRWGYRDRDTKTGAYLEIHNGYRFQELNKDNIATEPTGNQEPQSATPENADVRTDWRNYAAHLENISHNIEKYKQTGEAAEHSMLADFFQALNLGEKPSKEAIADALFKANGSTINQLYRQYGRAELVDLIIDLGLEKDCAKELQEAITAKARAMQNGSREEQELLAVFGGEKEFTTWLYGLSLHELGGGNVFNISPTGCVGPYQFTWSNSQGGLGLPFNPFNPKEATDGVIRLMLQNFDSLKKAGFPKDTFRKVIILAHNHGAGAVIAQINDLNAIQGAHGNPDGVGFYEKVAKMQERAKELFA